MRNYKRKSRWVNKEGYTNGVDSSMNNSNVIPSNQITMQNTSQPLYGTPLDEYGHPIGDQTVMYPGQDYDFGNASYVEEKPIFQSGGFYNQPHLNPYQHIQFDPYKKVSNTFTNPFQQQSFPELNFQDQGISYPTPQTIYPNEQGVNPEGLNQWNHAYLTGQEPPQGMYPNQTSLGEAEVEGTYSGEQDEDQQGTNGRFQFINPYAGVDLAGASAIFGKSLGEGNTGMSVVSGLKLGTGLARNFLSGLGAGKTNKRIEDTYKQNQRDYLSGANRKQSMQEGGQIQQDPISEVAQMLSQGIEPQEVFNMLIESGVPEQDAQAIIEQASQMFKFGGMLAEKKVKNYKFNKNTGNYEVEFE